MNPYEDSIENILSKEFKKRLANFISKTHEGKMISGYGGIEKYYN